MFKFLLAAVLLLIVGCKVNFDGTVKPIPKPIVEHIVINIGIDTQRLSESLANLALRAGKSEIRKSSVELNATLNELVADGVPVEYADKVRAAVPAIGKNPPRDLTPEEIDTLKKVR
jgi:hypothetical protein